MGPSTKLKADGPTYIDGPSRLPANVIQTRDAEVIEMSQVHNDIAGDEEEYEVTKPPVVANMLIWKFWILIRVAMNFVCLYLAFKPITSGDFSSTCDGGMWNYLISYSSFVLIETGLLVTLSICIPYRIQSALSWNTYVSFKYTFTVWIVLSPILFIQGLIIPIWVVNFNSATHECFADGSSSFMYSSSLTILLFETTRLCVTGVPFWIFPCYVLHSFLDPVVSMKTHGLPKSTVQKFREVDIAACVNINDKCKQCNQAWASTQGQRVRELPCRHLFHEECIAYMIYDKNECPACSVKFNKSGRLRDDDLGGGTPGY